MINYEEVLNGFKTKRLNGKNFKEIAGELELGSKHEKNDLRLILEKLEDENLISLYGDFYSLKNYQSSDETQTYSVKNNDERIKEKKFAKADGEFLTGVVRCNERGFGFLIVEGEKNDFFIPARRMGSAFQGDTVLAKRVRSSKSEDEVEVVKIISRGKSQICGTFYRDSQVDFVRPDDRGYLYDVIIPKLTEKVEVGDKVFVQITDYPKNDNPLGVITKNLGKSLELVAEESSIILNNGIKEEFEQATLDEAHAINQKVADNELIGRLDLRNDLIFTIDGETARDFDDAVSLTINENGNYVLGVHIADVSNYVTPESNLGKEAFERATSVYLPDRVIPMLPFELSNGICSLNEGVDRLTLSVIAEIDKKGKTLKRNYYKSVIRSSHRLTYTAVQAIIEGDKETCEKYGDIVETIKNMFALKTVMCENRKIAGEIDLNVKEADVFIVDGKITVAEHKSNDATSLIEQFMIFANEAVAEFLFDMKVPCVYRVHDKPSDEKVENFRIFLKQLGINASLEGDKPIEYQKILDKLKGEKSYGVVNRMMLRSMQKAEYSPENIGHFGLASECYLHFTSPIRRYPDLVVHRILKDVLDGKKAQLTALYGDFVQKASANSSLKERSAELCERDTDDLYMVKYMEDYVGEEYDGIISGVTSFGVFVELENTVEGLIRLENLPRGNYVFDEKRMCLSSGRRLSFILGESLHIGVVGVSVATRRIDFTYLGKNR